MASLHSNQEPEFMIAFVFGQQRRRTLQGTTLSAAADKAAHCPQ